MILVEVLQRIHHPLGILAADVLERIEPSGAPHELGLDLIQRAPARSGRFCGRGLQIHVCSFADSCSRALMYIQPINSDAFTRVERVHGRGIR